MSQPNERRQKAMENGINFEIYADSDEALELAGVQTTRTLQNYVKDNKLSVNKIQLPGDKFKTNFYPRAELTKIKQMRETPKISPGMMMTSANGNNQDNTRNALSPIVGSAVLEPFSEILSAIKGGLDAIISNQKQLPPATSEQSKPQFLTLEEAIDEFHISRAGIKELIAAGRLTLIKGKHGKQLLSRKELESL